MKVKLESVSIKLRIETLFLDNAECTNRKFFFSYFFQQKYWIESFLNENLEKVTSSNFMDISKKYLRKKQHLISKFYNFSTQKKMSAEKL